MHRHGLGDDEWDRIKHLLPGQPGWVGVTAKDNRRFVEAVFYRSVLALDFPQNDSLAVPVAPRLPLDAR